MLVKYFHSLWARRIRLWHGILASMTVCTFPYQSSEVTILYFTVQLASDIWKIQFPLEFNRIQNKNIKPRIPIITTFKGIGCQNNGSLAQKYYCIRSKHWSCFCMMHVCRSVSAVIHVYCVCMWKQKPLLPFEEIAVGRPDGSNVTSSLWKWCSVEIWSKNKHIGATAGTLRGIHCYELDEKHIVT